MRAVDKCLHADIPSVRQEWVSAVQAGDSNVRLLERPQARSGL
jgi:hypothetical protein